LAGRPLVTTNRATTFELRYRLPHPCHPLRCTHANDLKDLTKKDGDTIPEDIEIDVSGTYNETWFSNFRDYYNDVCNG